jgi:hypothetical protein
VAWPLVQAGSVLFRASHRLFLWADALEQWAGINYDPSQDDDYRVGGTD